MHISAREEAVNLMLERGDAGLSLGVAYGQRRRAPRRDRSIANASPTSALGSIQRASCEDSFSLDALHLEGAVLVAEDNVFIQELTRDL